MADMRAASFYNDDLTLTGSLGSDSNTRGYEAGIDTGKYDLYLKLFSGELFKSYQNKTLARELFTRRTLKNGKSMQFIFTGELESHYHTPGNPILGAATVDANGDPASTNNLDVAEKMIVIDDLLIASTFVYDLDETLAHYDLRGEIARKLGYSLANAYDQKIFRTAALAAQQGRAVAGQKAGCRIEIGNANRRGQSGHAAKLKEAFFEAAIRFDECNIPAEGRVAILPPASYYDLITDTDQNLVNRDVVGDSLQQGNGVYSIAGIKLLKSNNLPTSNTAVTHTDGENNDYAYAANQNLQGLIVHKDSVGILEAIGPSVQTTSGDVSVMYQGDLIVGRLAMGASHLNVAGAVAIHAGGDDNAAADELAAATDESAGVIIDIA
jgi:hypothetical protein